MRTRRSAPGLLRSRVVAQRDCVDAPRLGRLGGGRETRPNPARRCSDRIRFCGSTCVRDTARRQVLKLSPGRGDAGEYKVMVSATDGADSQTALLDLVVNRNHSPPTWSGAVRFYDGHGFRDLHCPGAYCVGDGTVRLGVYACDAEGDGIRLE